VLLCLSHKFDNLLADLDREHIAFIRIIERNQRNIITDLEENQAIGGD
jgi:hypothetical protein